MRCLVPIRNCVYYYCIIKQNIQFIYIFVCVCARRKTKHRNAQQNTDNPLCPPHIVMISISQYVNMMMMIWEHITNVEIIIIPNCRSIIGMTKQNFHCFDPYRHKVLKWLLCTHTRKICMSCVSHQTIQSTDKYIQIANSPCSGLFVNTH
jgi:hypothetical protein